MRSRCLLARDHDSSSFTDVSSLKWPIGMMCRVKRYIFLINQRTWFNKPFKHIGTTVITYIETNTSHLAAATHCVAPMRCIEATVNSQQHTPTPGSNTDYLLANCDETHARPHFRLVNINLSAFVHCSSELNWILANHNTRRHITVIRLCCSTSGLVSSGMGSQLQVRNIYWYKFILLWVCACIRSEKNISTNQPATYVN